MKAQWVGTKSWVYRTRFNKPVSSFSSRILLVFDGLDTFAHVRLNGKTILESDNMFVPYRVDITDQVNGGGNDLEVVFDSALLKAAEIKKQHPEYKWLDFDGETSRPAVRKAQYHWGWDWGPILMCAGIWRPIRVEVYAGRISDIRADIEITADYKHAQVHVNATCESSVRHGLRADISIRFRGKTISTAASPIFSDGSISAGFNLTQPSLWMPRGYGAQSLYQVDVKLYSDNEELDSDSRRIGIRKVELIQESDVHGKSFYFRINGVDIFCGGANWIPGDSIQTNLTPERIRAWMELMTASNQVMIRHVEPLLVLQHL